MPLKSHVKVAKDSNKRNSLMETILKEDNKFILRFDKDEEVINGLVSFCNESSITAGFFSGIGACKEVELSSYDVDKKEYFSKSFQEKLEIVSLTGNVAKMEEKTIIHCHGSFSDPNMELIGGHVKKLIVSATCEILLILFDGKIERKYSKDIGLNLLD